MPSYEKLIREIINNPKDRRWREIERVLRGEGFWRVKGKKGSHQSYTNGDVIITVVIKQGKAMKRWYVEKVIELLNLREKYGE